VQTYGEHFLTVGNTADNYSSLEDKNVEIHPLFRHSTEQLKIDHCFGLYFVLQAGMNSA
jgi:hypothetical protein